MRMDGGQDNGNFALLDRRQRQLINVSHDNTLVLMFASGSVPPRPASLKSRLDVSKAAPGTQQFRLEVNGVVCSEGIAALGAAPDAARAMAELKSVLAAMQYRVWKDSPAELQHDCDLANQVWEKESTLKLRLPLEEREFTGRMRKFERETRQPLQSELFRVPEGMTVINAPS